MSIKIPEAEFSLGASKPEHFPKINKPEIAFSGRSNVGKSSLINSILMRKNLAHTSSTPGKTQQINFYLVDNRWICADLPGFGYAQTSKDNRSDWKKLIFDYFSKSENLKLVCVLIDSRHDPMEHDLALIEWLELNQKLYFIILTKCDKISKTQIAERKKQIDEFVQNCAYCKDVIPHSSINHLGREQVFGIINRYTKF